jgi:hypothetical protein
VLAGKHKHSVSAVASLAGKSKAFIDKWGSARDEAAIEQELISGSPGIS